MTNHVCYSPENCVLLNNLPSTKVDTVVYLRYLMHHAFSITCSEDIRPSYSEGSVLLPCASVDAREAFSTERGSSEGLLSSCSDVLDFVVESGFVYSWPVPRVQGLRSSCTDVVT